LRTDGKGRSRIESRAFGGIFRFTEACDMLWEQWKKIGFQADLADASWQSDAVTL
jgi:hypothetical protein